MSNPPKTVRKRYQNAALTSDEVRQIFRLNPANLYTKYKPEYAERDRFVLMLAFNMGCRIEEFVTIQRKKIDYQNCIITVEDRKKDSKWTWDIEKRFRDPHERRSDQGHYTKGKAWRAIRLPKDVMEEVKFYNETLPKNQKTLFTLSGKAVERIVQRYTTAIGNTKSFHAIRHTYATLAREAGIPVKFVAKQFGDRVGTVQTIYEELSDEQEDKYANTRLF